MRWYLITLLFTLALLSCRDQEIDPVAQQNEVPQDTVPGSAMHYLALGDSYTIGQSVDQSERWPVQLADAFSAEGSDIEVEIIAKTGWTTGELANGIETADPEGPYDLVSLLIGVNNQYRRLDTAAYRVEFRDLLHQAIHFAGDDTTRVFVVSIPDYSVTPFAQKLDTARIAQEIDAFNAINLSETRSFGISYVNVTPISRQARFNPSLIAGDGLHPSGKMYAQWVKLIKPVVEEILQPGT